MRETTLSEYLGLSTSEDTLSGDWTFASEDTQYATHRFHPYPARMVPQIARRVILTFTKEGDVVLDPFCGSGTVLVEARLSGRNSIGIDINPLAILIANVKSDPPYAEDIIRVANNIKEQINELRKIPNAELKDHVKIPSFTNIDYWFKPYVIIRLSAIRQILEKTLAHESSKIARFFWVCFAWTVRYTSNVRKKEYKLYRMPERELKRFKPDVYREFLEIIREYTKGVGDFWKTISNAGRECYAMAMLSDSRKIPLRDESVDLIITSPPYGDSRTTVAYGQFSRLQLCWLGWNEEYIKMLDEISLGGKLDPHSIIDVPSLKRTIAEIAKRDSGRALDAMRFYCGLWNCIEEMYRVLNKGGVMAIVIANRSIRRVRAPTHQIIREFGEKLGLDHIKTIPRRIAKKRLPWKNAPENIPGFKEETMAREHIVIMRKRA